MTDSSENPNEPTNLVARILAWWRGRHRHAYVEKVVHAGEAWGVPAYLVEQKCACGKALYHLATVPGVEMIDQTWAKKFLENLVAGQDARP
jgi:hypothetical protein